MEHQTNGLFYSPASVPTSLFPLFPGSDELDQLAKIHDVLGTPSPALLQKIRKSVDGVAFFNTFFLNLIFIYFATHRNGGPSRFDFSPQPGQDLAQLLPRASADCIDLLSGLLAYDADLRCGLPLHFFSSS